MYVAAYAPEAGETLGAINARYPDVPLSAALRTFTYTDDRGEQATDTYVDATLFHDAVCAEAPGSPRTTSTRLSPVLTARSRWSSTSRSPSRSVSLLARTRPHRGRV